MIICPQESVPRPGGGCVAVPHREGDLEPRLALHAGASGRGGGDGDLQAGGG